MTACIKCKKEKRGRKECLCRSCASSLAWSKKPSTFVVRKCLECGKDFTAERSKIWHGGGKYCCRKCFTTYFGKHFKPVLGKTWRHTDEYKRRLSASRMGEKNPAYKHGAYSGKSRRGVQQPQKEWRKKIFMRDGYTCQACRKRNGDGTTTVLNAHHIIPWGVDEQARFDEKNGATICTKCHRAIHREYSKHERSGNKVDYPSIFRNFIRQYDTL